MRPLAAAALALAFVAAVLIYVPERQPLAPIPSPGAPVERIESAPPAAIPSPPPSPPPETPVPPPLPVPAPLPRGPIETIPTSPHSWLMRQLIDMRLDDVDGCRDRLTLPALDQLLARSTILAELGVATTRAQEASLQQTFVFQVSASNDAYWIDSAEVIESSLEFPAPDGTMRRASFDDAALDRCVEGALRGSKVESKGAPDGERFWIQGPAGEAVYDLPPR